MPAPPAHRITKKPADYTCPDHNTDLTGQVLDALVLAAAPVITAALAVTAALAAQMLTITRHLNPRA